jgi:hypothetical protein
MEETSSSGRIDRYPGNLISRDGGFHLLLCACGSGSKILPAANQRAAERNDLSSAIANLLRTKQKTVGPHILLALNPLHPSTGPSLSSLSSPARHLFSPLYSASLQQSQWPPRHLLRGWSPTVALLPTCGRLLSVFRPWVQSQTSPPQCRELLHQLVLLSLDFVYLRRGNGTRILSLR